MSIKYELTIYWCEQNQAFVVEVPELYGCKAQGINYVEAVKNVEIAIQEWIANAEELGLCIPSPKQRLIYA